eukprot:gene189-3_t
MVNEARYKELKKRVKAFKEGGPTLTKEEISEFKKLKKQREEQKEHEDEEEEAIEGSEQPAASPGIGFLTFDSQDSETTLERKQKKAIQRARSPKQHKVVKIMETTEEMIEPENTWWHDMDDAAGLQKDAVKWASLEHHGIMFAADYEPHGVPLLYGPNKDPLVLPPDLEELGTMWCSVIGLEAETKEIFINNFWYEFKSCMARLKDSKLQAKVKDFRHCDWSKMKEHIDAEKLRKKEMTKEEKEGDLRARQAEEQWYRYCLIEGYREKVGVVRVEPPGLFRGRGEHPKQGKLKERIMPENCVMNVDNAIVPPICHVPGRAWEDVVHDDKVGWLGFYKQQTDGADAVKYIQMDKTSENKTKPDLIKYERAKRLAYRVDEIRKDYQRKLKHESMTLRQPGTCAYFIDRLALRVGGEKNTDEEADTVGCCSLRVEHVRLNMESFKQNRPKITLDFLGTYIYISLSQTSHSALGRLEFRFRYWSFPTPSKKWQLNPHTGKDSIRYMTEVCVPPTVFKNLGLFMKGKRPADQLFDKVSPSDMNEFFQEFMDDLTAKVFRTYNASVTLERQLSLFDQATDIDKKSQDQLLKFYNEANRKVAILCNHQKAVGKGHEAGVQKLQEKGDDLKKRLQVVKKHKALLEGGDDGVEPDEDD